MTFNSFKKNVLILLANLYLSYLYGLYIINSSARSYCTLGEIYEWLNCEYIVLKIGGNKHKVIVNQIEDSSDGRGKSKIVFVFSLNNSEKQNTFHFYTKYSMRKNIGKLKKYIMACNES